MPKKATSKAKPDAKPTDRNEEVYWLWYEYLKRSKDYKDFCDWVRENEPQEFRELPLFSPSTTEAYFNFLTGNIRCKIKTRLPEKFHRQSNGSSAKEKNTFLRFRDVHKIPFKEWWKYHIENHKKRKNEVLPGDPGTIEDYNIWIEKDINQCVESFKRSTKREPTVEELKKLLIERLGEGDFLCLAVRPQGRTTDYLIKEFRKIINRHRGKPVHKLYELFHKQASLEPVSKVMIDDLKYYLKVYDLRMKKTKWKDIIQELGSSCGDKEIQRREFLRYYSKANTIIKNVERGVFPKY